MADIEKVKQGLDRCKHFDGKYCFVCPYAKQNKKPFPPTCNKELCNDALSVIEELQAEIARLQPKKGKWEMKEDPFGLFDEIPVCSECGCTNAMRKKTEFCEHCGADMREGDRE